jgi:hypothetical protein
MLKLRTAAVALAATASLVAGTATTADAASYVSIHKIKGKTIKKNAKTTIRPKVSHKNHVKIDSKSITVKKGDRTIVDHRSSARLKPGTYRVTTTASYRVSRVVTRTREVSSLKYREGVTLPGRCSVVDVTNTDAENAALDLSCQASAFTSEDFPADVSAHDNGDGTWMVTMDDQSTQSLASDDGAYGLMGQSVTGAVTAASPVYKITVEKYKKRAYGKSHKKSKSQTLKIKAKKPKPKHPCTRTASGTCIAGGQFCPQAKYGKSGWDASGRRYVCKGDHTHPHWYKP